MNYKENFFSSIDEKALIQALIFTIILILYTSYQARELIINRYGVSLFILNVFACPLVIYLYYKYRGSYRRYKS